MDIIEQVLYRLSLYKRVIEWYMKNTTPDNNDYQTFHDLGMNMLGSIEETEKFLNGEGIQENVKGLKPEHQEIIKPYNNPDTERNVNEF